MAQSFSDEEYVVQEERVESIQRELAKIRGIVSRIDDMAHGGRYDTTEYLHGSRMADLGRDDIVAEGPIGARPATRALNGLRLLVVDDDLGVCYSLRDLLTEEGGTVEVATNGLEALKVLDRCALEPHPFDMVLSDVVMPDLDGYDLYMEAKERYPDLPVVLMTAYFYDKDHVIKRSRLEGLENVLFKKPVDPDRLKETILGLCKSSAP